MSASKSKYRDEARHEDKRHKKSENRKSKNPEDSFHHQSKKKRGDYDNRDERISPEDDDYRSDLNRKKKEGKYIMDKSISPESGDNLEHRRKSKKKYDKIERLDKENDFYVTNYDKNEKVNYDEDDMMSKDIDDDREKETKRKHKKNDDREKETKRKQKKNDDREKDTKRKQKKNDDGLYSKDNFDEERGRKSDSEKDKRVGADGHRSKRKHVEQSERNKHQSQNKYSSGEENYKSRNRTDHVNQIRSSVHKIENKTRNDSTNDEQNDTDNSDDLRMDTTKYKSKQYEAEKDKKRNYKEQYLDRYSSDADDRTDQDRLKSDRIRSSVHKIENKPRNNKKNDDEQGNIDDGDNYCDLRNDSSKYKSKRYDVEKERGRNNKINDEEQVNIDDSDNYDCDLRNDSSKYKSKRYDVEKERGRQSDRYSEEYSNKRKRDYQSETKRLDTRTDKNTEDQRYKKRDERISQSQDNFESNCPSADPVADSAEPLSKRQKIGNINMRTGGAYIPPARLRMMQESIKDKGSEEYQRIAWEALKKSIVGMTNKINSSNITEIIPELFKENIIRGRGVLSRAIMQAQAASPTFTRVYAALVAIINTKFPEIGELILNRLIIQYKRGFRRNDKTICMTAARFLAQLLNQEVAHEILILEIVTHLLENPTEDSVEIAIATLKECGKKLTQLTPKGMRAITQRVRDVLHEASIDMRVRYMIEVFFAVQKDGFKDFEVIPPELDLVEEDDKYTHLINLNEAVDAQDMLNVFKFDPEYLENEEKYKSVVNEILGESSDESGNESDDESEEDEEKEENADGSDQKILDMTETNLVCLRRKIYLTIQSSLDFEECAHKLLKLELKPGQILEMCYMILDCCAQQRTYEKFYGLLAQRFCQLNKIYVEPFTEIFDNSYKTIHRLETNKLRNVAKFFAHLLYTDAISWNVLSIIKLNEDDTTSSSRIFIKILFQELCEYMGLPKLNERVKDVTLQEAFEGLFPRDHPHNTRFAINFFTSIGLGGLTDELREHLKNLPKNPAPLVPDTPVLSGSSSSDSSSSTSSSSSSSSSSSTSSDSDSDSTKNNLLKKRKASQKRKKQ